MNENEKKQLTTEEALKELMKTEDTRVLNFDSYVDRLVDLFIDLIAERSEEKAEERVDLHEREWDHGLIY